jgi:hypothetical protein
MGETALLIGFWVIASTLWVLSATVWKARTLRALPPGHPAWFWLRVLGFPETDRYRGLLLNAVAIIGIVAVTASE